MKPYNGHRSWNAWNVALWIGNDEPLYRFAMECITGINNNKRGLALATRRFVRGMGGCRTPDGAAYNALSVKLALQGFIEDQQPTISANLAEIPEPTISENLI